MSYSFRKYVRSCGFGVMLLSLVLFTYSFLGHASFQSLSTLRWASVFSYAVGMGIMLLGSRGLKDMPGSIQGAAWSRGDTVGIC